MSDRDLDRVGKRAPRVDGPGLVAGTAQFTDDIEMRGMLHESPPPPCSASGQNRIRSRYVRYVF